jgi:hypothetical protein
MLNKIREIFHPTDRIVLNSVVVRNQVFDGDGNRVQSLVGGKMYKHSLELVRNLALWDLQFDILSEVSPGAGFHFLGDELKWGFTTELAPDEGEREHVEALVCRTGRPGYDRVATKFACDSGHQDSMTLELTVIDPVSVP